MSRYQGRTERGVENYVTELTSRLSKLGHKVEVFTSFWQLLNQKRSNLEFSRSDFTEPVIIYPLNGSWQSLGCRIYAWLTGAKLVVGGHAGIGKDDGWNLYMFPDLFIAFSQKGYDWAKKINRFVKIVRISHGVDLDKFNPKVKPLNINLDRPICITVSHLDRYKRVQDTVRGVAKLTKGSLLILGDGLLEKEVDELGNKLLGPKRYLRLSVSHQDVPRYLAGADIFTLVSESSEAFGLVYLEAMACNLPVVATDDSLRREIIGAAGIFVKNPEDSQEYAKALEAAAKIDWRDKPLVQARKFDWDKIAKVYENAFDKLIH